MKSFVFVLALLGVASAVPGLRKRRDSLPFLFELPSNASLILGGVQTGFECSDLPYGYYADESNSCAIYHVCLPYIDHDLFTVRQFSFLCGEGTVFDQERLICDFPQNALPCNQAATFRKSNEYFGRESPKFLEK